VGCSGGEYLSGQWLGTVSCPNGATAGVTLSINEPNDSLNHTGTFFIEAINNTTLDGEAILQESDWTGDLVIQLDDEIKEGDEQTSDLDLTQRAPSCTFRDDNEEILNANDSGGTNGDCFYNGLDSGFDFVELYEADWDGEDEMDLSSTTCVGTVAR